MGDRKRVHTIPIFKWEEKRPKMGRSATGSFPFAALGGIVALFLFPCFDLPADGVTKSEQGRAKGRTGEKKSKSFCKSKEEREPQTLTLIYKTLRTPMWQSYDEVSSDVDEP